MAPINKPSNPTNNTAYKRTASIALSPRENIKNKFSPLSDLVDTDNDQSDKIEIDTPEVRQKIPPLYVYDITDYIHFRDTITPMIIDEFSIANKNTVLRLNLTSVDDYRTLTKYFTEIKIKYHTYQLPEDGNLSVIIRNLPTSIPEEQIFNAITDLNFSVVSVTRLQNKHKSPIPIVAVLLEKTAIDIFSVDRLLNCIVSIENRKTDSNIPQCQNCQRFQHTKNFSKLPPRCVKCSGDHHYSACTKDSSTPPTCVNCLGNHPANYRGCTAYKQLKIKSQQTNSKNTTTHKQSNTEVNIYSNNHASASQNVAYNHLSQNSTNPPVFSNINKQSYAEITKTNTYEHRQLPPSQPNIQSELLQLLMPTINSLLQEIIKKVIEYIPTLLSQVNGSQLQ